MQQGSKERQKRANLLEGFHLCKSIGKVRRGLFIDVSIAQDDAELCDFIPVNLVLGQSFLWTI